MPLFVNATRTVPDFRSGTTERDASFDLRDTCLTSSAIQAPGRAQPRSASICTMRREYIPLYDFSSAAGGVTRGATLRPAFTSAAILAPRTVRHIAFADIPSKSSRSKDGASRRPSRAASYGRTWGGSPRTSLSADGSSQTFLTSSSGAFVAPTGLWRSLPTRMFSAKSLFGGNSESPRTFTANPASPHTTLRTRMFDIAVGHVFSAFFVSSFTGLPS